MGVKRSRSLSPSEDPNSPTSREHSVDVKIVHLDVESAVSDRPAIMKCSLPPHEPLTFASFEQYEVHYQKAHVNRCTECNKNFPDEHFLHLHIAENHDPINAAKRERGEKTFACLLPTCDRVCSTAHKRRLHLIDKHQFPRNYDFFIVNDGIDRRSSMLRPPPRRRSSTINSTASQSGRRRGESNAGVANAETMDVVRDEDQDVKNEEEKDDGDEEVRRAPVKLRGRGGFQHPRGQDRGRGSGRGRGRGRGTASTLTQASGSASKTGPAATADPMEGLTSSMSALQFVPHSIYARGRGRGRGA